MENPNSSDKDKDMVDSGVDQVQRSDRLSVTETDEASVPATYEIRSSSVGEDDEAVIVENPTSSQEVSIYL